jgi:hypothetical protein
MQIHHTACRQGEDIGSERPAVVYASRETLSASVSADICAAGYA